MKDQHRGTTHPSQRNARGGPPDAWPRQGTHPHPHPASSAAAATGAPLAPASHAAAPSHPAGERLQKVLAHAGIASRRHAELLMRQGRVTINGAAVRELGTRVHPAADDIRVDGEPIHVGTRRRYILLNKPAGPITTATDPQGRRTVLDLLPTALRAGNLYPVGRLDRDTEGLLLLTDDGDLALHLTHPRYALPKVYEALVTGHPAPAALRALANGIHLPGVEQPTAPARAWHIRAQGADAWIGLEVHEGRNRQVRRMLEAVGHPVLRLRRTRVGPLELGPLPVGQWRELNAHELGTLLQAIGAAPAATTPDA